jgi:hypothetical protein
MHFESVKNFPSDFFLQKAFWQANAQSIIGNYTNNKNSYLVGCQPAIALQMPTAQIIYILSKRFGDDKVRFCLNPDNVFDSPIAHQPDTEWLKTVSMVGVNVRTIGSFWNVVKYAFTLPRHQSSIHLLPIWECGVVASLYGMASWYINTEFFDNEIAQQFPNLNTVEKQLKVTINLLHLMGKTVGMDVVPHTDRYSEIALANPHYFEWLQRKDFEIIDHSDQLINIVQNTITDFLGEKGSASGDYFPRNSSEFFDDAKNSEDVRLRILFGKKENKESRNSRRNQLINYLFAQGLEPVPATMAPPYRGLIVDPSDTAKTVDNEGRVWRDYIIEKPQKMSRVFGPLARYKLYNSKNNNTNWELDFKSPKKNVFEYVAEKYLKVSLEYNIDFMRGDMSHVQMNPKVDENKIDNYYDIHKYVKAYIGKVKPSFGYFAESFLVEDNLMAFGNEAKHLNLSDTDTTLGNLQSIALNDPEFTTEFIKYYHLGSTEKFKPNFTIFTADKDDPRFDIFYLEGNEVRYFMATFFKFFPSYSSLGFEMRDMHLMPAPNEYYTKLFVFQINEGDKATHGPYRWGENGPLFYNLQQINIIADQLFAESSSPTFSGLSTLEIFDKEKIMSWQLAFEGQSYLFIITLKLPKKSYLFDLTHYPKAELIDHFNAQGSKGLKGNSILFDSYSYAIVKLS